MILTDMASLFLALFPALLCSLGIYGMLITQIDEPSTSEHLIMAAIGLLPSMILYVVLVKMEASRTSKVQKRRERKLLMKQYAKNTPFNNGTGLLSRYDGSTSFDPLSQEDIKLMKEELKKQVGEKIDKGTLQNVKGKCLDLSVSTFSDKEDLAVGDGVKAYFRSKDKPQSVLQKQRSEHLHHQRSSQSNQVSQDPLSSLEQAVKERIQKAKTPEEASPFRPINEESVQDTLRYLEEVRRQKFSSKKI